MATLAQSALAQTETPSIARRRLAPNVVCMFADDRPPVINRGRRGRYPKLVKSLWSMRRLRVGALCELNTARNANIPVRIVEEIEPGRYGVMALAGLRILCSDGELSLGAVVTNQQLRRSVVLDLQFSKGEQK